MSRGRRRRSLSPSLRKSLVCLLDTTIFCAAIPWLLSPTFAQVGPVHPARDEASALPDMRTDRFPTMLPVIEGHDIRFRRLSESTGLSQTRVSSVVQDNPGFVWFATQYGLNRYDGYKSKVFKHESGRADSLSCVYIRGLFVDHSGALWVGCEGVLDKFEPITETFAHYRIDTEGTRRPALMQQITEDHAGIFWLPTGKGLYRFDPATGHATRYVHDPGDPASISGNSVTSVGEDRTGRFWVANSGGVDEFDRKTGKVIWHAPFRSDVDRFHEDRFGIFWITTSDSSCRLATLNRTTGRITCHTIDYKSRGITTPGNVSGILESRDGTMWLSSSAGLLRLDRQHKRVVRYHNQPSDGESLASDNVIALYQDKEANIWTCFQDTEPSVFSETPQAFENFTYQRGSLVNRLVTSIYEDHNGILWIGSMGGLNRIDRRTGRNTVPPGTGVGNELLSILEDRSGVLFAGTYYQGLQRLDPKTGAAKPYVRSREPSNLANSPIARMIFDHTGTLWAATYGSVSRFDSTTGNLITYTLDKQSAVGYQVGYQEITEDSKGILWLGAQSGLHRFDPSAGKFTVYEHDPDNPSSLSNNRVNSVHVDRLGDMWVGTQDGLDKFDPRTGTFKTYYQQDGLAGDVVSCILEDKRGLLWMSTNNGLSTFDPQSQRFRNFSAADGLPGADLTGWGACYESPSGEMFFGGFAGATAFYPSKIVNSPFVPRTVLTELRISGIPVPIGRKSPLKRSITFSDSITLSHQQNMFSIEFSALSYFNPETNRYRFKLEGLDDHWHEVGSSQRTANYTTLPAATYTFRVQGATSRGAWSDPGLQLRIDILPPWWNTWWFRVLSAAACLGVLWVLHRLRLHQIAQQYNARMEERVNERTRIARELHDTLLQSFQALMIHFQVVDNLLPPGKGKEALEKVLDRTDQALVEGRNAIQNIRSSTTVTNELSHAMTALGEELVGSHGGKNGLATFRVSVEGTPRDLRPILRDDIYRIAREALGNAFRYAQASQIEAEITYGERILRLRIRDDGKGIDPKHLHAGRDRHWGLPGMRERAQQIGAQFEMWSEVGAGTEVELRIPGSIVYEKARGRGLWLFRKKKEGSDER
jgi:signal transduction histidine kinase/ligand-binding sensor domain-containing protein